MKKKINLNKGMTSNSTKNINIKMNKNIISNKNNNSNKDIKIENINNNKNININKNDIEIKQYAQKKIKENKNILSPILYQKNENQNINPNSLLKKEKEKEKEKEKDKIILNNKIPIKEPEKEKIENLNIIKENKEDIPIIKENKENVPIIKENINKIENVPLIKEEQNQVQNQIIEENKETKVTNKVKENKEIITKAEIINHKREKNSSISNYIFKEDYRIKEDIESSSNFNILEGSMKNETKKITSQNFSQSDFHIEKNEDVDKNINNKDKLTNDNIYNNNVNEINNINEEQINNMEQKKDNNITKKRKSKFIFKINIKKRLIKLIINKGDDVESKIDAFCKENDLDEDDKEEIVQAINANLKI